ncbi:MAG: hypothetical protein ACOH2D_15170 [Gelidibacter sp.]
MIIYYFGADNAWEQQDHSSLRRRNMAVLYALSKQESITRIYNIIRCSRSTIFKKRKSQSDKNSKIVNIYVGPILPERGFLKSIFHPLNRGLLRLMYRNVFCILRNHENLAWCYWPKGYEDFEYLSLKMEMIFDTDHNIINEPNNVESMKIERKNLLIRAGKRAKFILSSSRSMLHWYQEKGFINTKVLMNGLFEERINLLPLVREGKRYTVTYCGTLSKWIKIDWLFNIIEQHPEWDFNFIGANYKTDIDLQLTKFSNVKLFGFLEPKEVDVILKHSDVCFGLYQNDAALDVNSMKLYDYLAQGIPVVVNNYHSKLKDDFNDLLNIANNYEEFENLLANPKPMNIIDLEQFLKVSTWKQRVKNIVNEIVA